MINKVSVRSAPLTKKVVNFSPFTVRTLRWPHKKLVTTTYLPQVIYEPLFLLVKGDVKDKVGGSKS